MYGLDLAGAMGLPPELSVSMLEFLLFASLIVAVDPVAVLAIFQDVGVHKTLYFLVFGESLLNGKDRSISGFGDLKVLVSRSFDLVDDLSRQKFDVNLFSFNSDIFQHKISSLQS